MKFYWRITLASALGTLPFSYVHADTNSAQSEKPTVSQQGVTYVAQPEVSGVDKWLVKPSENTYKWTIKPPEDNFKWAIASSDKSTLLSPAPAKSEDSKKPTSYFRPSSSYSTQPESDPPRYVRNLSKIGIEAFKNITWLDIGLEHRTRYEFRSNDLKRTQFGVDQPFLLRTKAYLGIKEILDPLRGAVEFQDSRRYNSKFPIDNRDVNEFELIQAYGELYFKNAFGEDDRRQNRPLRFRAGRMAYEALDRRLISTNPWRNTTNNFEGFRINLGREVNDWELDLWGYQPVKRLPTTFDQRIENQWFYGVIGHWRKWADVITLQPYYMGLMQDGSKTGQIDRQIYAPALRGYGKVTNTDLDFDFNLMYQFGRNGTQQHDAYGYTTEIGYTFKHDWKPRLSAFYGYASGDRNPQDNVDNRFERFYGAGRPWEQDNYIGFENIKAPKFRFELQPVKDLRFDGAYSLFWLASKTDRLNDLLSGNNSSVANPGFNRDPSGKSGDFIGQAFDIRARYRLAAHIDTTVGYSHFISGEFVRNRQIAALGHSPGSSDFFYFEVVINAF